VVHGNYVTVLPAKREPPDPYSRPVRRALHGQVRQYMALLLPMLLKQQAFAQVPTTFVFHSELSSRVQDASDCCLLDQERYSRRDMQFASHRVPSVPGHQIQREQVRKTERAPTPDNQEAEAQVVQDVVVVPRSLQLQAQQLNFKYQDIQLLKNHHGQFLQDRLKVQEEVWHPRGLPIRSEANLLPEVQEVWHPKGLLIKSEAYLLPTIICLSVFN